jgi:lipopolysaccharide heptosyltransferase III
MPSTLVATRSKPAARGNSRLRALDRTAGMAFLAAAGALKRRRSLPAEIRRIGILKSTGIGDMTLLAGVARDVAAAYPDATVVLVAGRDNADVARLVGGVEVVTVPIGEPLETIRRLRALDLDVLLDFGQWTRVEALCSFLSGARYTIGFETPGQRRHYCYDSTVRHSADVHELENYRRLAGRLGVESVTVPKLGEPGSNGWKPAAPPFVVFHLWPGGFRSELKEWPLDSWRELATRLAGRGYSIVLTGAPADAVRTERFARSCAGLTGRVESVAGRYALAELVGLLRRASCIVSVNTGVMHLAAASGAPTVALNGPTSEARWGPVGERTRSVNADLPGCGYLNLGFEYDRGRTDCMRAISVDRVADAVFDLLGDG